MVDVKQDVAREMRLGEHVARALAQRALHRRRRGPQARRDERVGQRRPGCGSRAWRRTARACGGRRASAATSFRSVSSSAYRRASSNGVQLDMTHSERGSQSPRAPLGAWLSAAWATAGQEGEEGGGDDQQAAGHGGLLAERGGHSSQRQRHARTPPHPGWRVRTPCRPRRYIRLQSPRARTKRTSTPAQSATPAYRWPSGPVTIHAASTTCGGRRRRTVLTIRWNACPPQSPPPSPSCPSRA